MNAEWFSEIERRAALHGVLADAGRLAIVEFLRWSDRSPSELAQELGFASNLVAHHVGVLVDQGIVERTRSEGDKRRTYLSLKSGVLDLLTTAHAPQQIPERVLFVCTANSARSQLASALWRRVSALPASSAGTHPAARVAPGAVRAARRHGLDGLGQPRSLRDERAPGDFVVTVCDRAYEESGDPTSAHWSVPDPVPAGTDDVFDQTVAHLERRTADLAAHLGLRPGNVLETQPEGE